MDKIKLYWAEMFRTINNNASLTDYEKLLAFKSYCNEEEKIINVKFDKMETDGQI